MAISSANNNMPTMDQLKQQIQGITQALPAQDPLKIKLTAITQQVFGSGGGFQEAIPSIRACLIAISERHLDLVGASVISAIHNLDLFSPKAPSHAAKPKTAKPVGTSTPTPRAAAYAETRQAAPTPTVQKEAFAACEKISIGITENPGYRSELRKYATQLFIEHDFRFLGQMQATLYNIRNSNPHLSEEILALEKSISRMQLEQLCNLPEEERMKVTTLNFVDSKGVDSLKLADKWHLFPNLQVVDFRSSDVVDETLRGLPPSVQHVSLRHCLQITDRAMTFLPKELRLLDLSVTNQFSDAIWKTIGERCPRLERLYIGDDWDEGDHDNFVGKGMELLPQTMKFIELYSGLSTEVSATHIHRFERTHPHARVSYEGSYSQLSLSEKADLDYEDRMVEKRPQLSVSIKGPTGSEQELLQTKLSALLQEIPEVSLHHRALQKAMQEHFDAPSKAKLEGLRAEVIQIRKELPHLLSRDELTVLNRLMQILLKKPSEGGSLTQAMKRLSINDDSKMRE